MTYIKTVKVFFKIKFVKLTVWLSRSFSWPLGRFEWPMSSCLRSSRSLAWPMKRLLVAAFYGFSLVHCTISLWRQTPVRHGDDELFIGILITDENFTYI